MMQCTVTYAEIAPRLDAIDREFAEEHGFGFRPRIQGAGDQVDEGLLAARDTAQPPDREVGSGASL